MRGHAASRGPGRSGLPASSGLVSARLDRTRRRRSQNELGQIRSLGQMADVGAHVVRIDHQLFAGPIRGREADLSNQPLRAPPMQGKEQRKEE